MADQSDLIQAKTNQIFRGHVSLLSSCIDEAKASGEISAKMESTDLAEFLYNAWEGALMRMKATHCDHAITVFLTSLDFIAE
jgi:TetR/AcrR family transcriptional repressor of nem operon